MPLRVAVGLGPGDFVLDGDPAPLPKKGAELPNFRPMSIVAKRLDGSKWHLAWRWATLCYGTHLPSPKWAQPTIFGPYLLWPNGWMDEDTTWYGSMPRPKRLCVRWGPRFPLEKKAQPPTQFVAHDYCGQAAG